MPTDEGMPTGYGCAAVSYLNRAMALPRDSAQNWFYVAWELRCCIERTLFEYLLVMNHPNITRAMEKLYKPTRLRGAILGLDPEFTTKVQFASIVTEVLKDLKPVVPDLDLLNHLYGQLSDYLHAPKRPEETTANDEWWQRFKTLLEETSKALIAIHEVPVFFANPISDAGRSVYEQWKKGDLTGDDVKRKLRELLGMDAGRWGLRPSDHVY